MMMIKLLVHCLFDLVIEGKLDILELNFTNLINFQPYD